MSLKAGLETWTAALKAYDEEDFLMAINLFEQISDIYTSKILTNIGLIHALTGEHDMAVESFSAATLKDPFLAIAHFQRGVSNFLLQQFVEAFEDFSEAFINLRGNSCINYQQLGLNFYLYQAEVLFNTGLCLIYQSRPEEGLEYLRRANDARLMEEHAVIEEAIAELGDGYTVFSIPVGMLFKPSESLVKMVNNLRAEDYPGLETITGASVNNAYTARLRQGFTSDVLLYSQSQDIDVEGAFTKPAGKPKATASGRFLSRLKTLVARPEKDDPTLLFKRPASVVPSPPGLDKSRSTSLPGLARSRTTLELRTPSPQPDPTQPRAPSFGPPVRGLSTRRPATPDREVPGPLRVLARPEQRPATRQQEQNARRMDARTTDFVTAADSSSPSQRDIQRFRDQRFRERSRRETLSYDDYIDGYGEVEDEPELLTRRSDMGRPRGGGSGRSSTVESGETSADSLEGAITSTSTSIPLSSDITALVSLVHPDRIGLGGFGDLFLGKHKDRGKVALKRPHRLFDDDSIRRFLREVDLWCSVSHRYVLPCLGMCKIGPDIYVVSPFIENGDLLSCMIRGKAMNRSKLLYEVAEALAHLHHRGIVHGDIKAQNILLADDGSALLCDFGLAKAFDTMVTSTESKGTGSVRWMAPELFENGSRSMASDVYSLGVTIAEVLSGQPPFPEISDNLAVMFHVVFKKGKPPKMPTHSSDGKSYSTLWETAEKCWATEVEDRPHMAQVLGMLFPLTRQRG